MTFDEFFDKQDGTRHALVGRPMSDSARNEYHSGDDPEHDCDDWLVLETTNQQRDVWVCEVCGQQAIMGSVPS